MAQIGCGRWRRLSQREGREQPGGGVTGQAAAQATHVLTSAVPIAGDVLGFLHKGPPLVYKAGTRFGMQTNADVVVQVPERALHKSDSSATRDSSAKQP